MINLRRPGFLLVLALAGFELQTFATSNLLVRVMAANITSGTQQSYESPGIRIFQGLKPDVVAIQEFRYNSSSVSNDLRQLVNTAFGTGFYFYCEPSGNIPNGIVSRFPISAAGSWDDPFVSDRGFAWAQIDLPESNKLYVVSVHLYGSGTSAQRGTEAAIINAHIQTNLPAGAWVIVGGDMNTSSRTEAAINNFTTILSDDPVPTDAVSGGDDDTNEPRNNPYDYVLPSFSLTNYLTSLALPSHTFSKGLVFDSHVYTPLGDVSPVAYADSHVTGMQHMAVIKDFLIPVDAPNSNAPSITTQPQNVTVAAGQNATFDVTATGSSPLSYQWRFGEADLASATQSSFTRTNAQASDAGDYSVVITNSAGSVTSSVAILTVNSDVGSGTIIAQWNFDSAPLDGDSGTGSLNPSSGAGSASYVGGAAAASSGEFASGSSTDTNTTDNSGWNTSNYPAASSGNKTAGVQFNVSTAGRQNIVIRWDQRHSGSASKYTRLQYSTNGTDFVDVSKPGTNSTTSFETKTNSLTAIAAVNDNPNFAFRIVAEFENTAIGSGSASYVGTTSTYGTGGTARFDMLTVAGDSISASNPPPAPAMLSAPLFSAGQFQFLLAGSAGSNYVIQATTNLTASNWVSLLTNASPFGFTETNTSDFPQRFYRAIAPR